MAPRKGSKWNRCIAFSFVAVSEAYRCASLCFLITSLPNHLPLTQCPRNLLLDLKQPIGFSWQYNTKLFPLCPGGGYPLCRVWPFVRVIVQWGMCACAHYCSKGCWLPGTYSIPEYVGRGVVLGYESSSSAVPQGGSRNLEMMVPGNE